MSVDPDDFFDWFTEEVTKVITKHEDEAIMLIRDFSGLRIGHFNDYAGQVITFPADTSREDFDRMKVEIQAALEQAELRGEQKAMAFLMGEGSGTPVGIVGQPELNEKPSGEQ